MEYRYPGRSAMQVSFFTFGPMTFGGKGVSGQIGFS